MCGQSARSYCSVYGWRMVLWLPIVYNVMPAHSCYPLDLVISHASVGLRPLSFLCTGSRGQLPCTGGFSHIVLPTGPLLIASADRKRHQRRKHLQRLCSRCEKGKRELESLWKLSTCRTLITASSRHTAGVSKCTSRRESSL